MKWIVTASDGTTRCVNFSSEWLRRYQNLNKIAGKHGISPVITWRFEY